jgi:hypothetical protein
MAEVTIAAGSVSRTTTSVNPRAPEASRMTAALPSLRKVRRSCGRRMETRLPRPEWSSSARSGTKTCRVRRRSTDPAPQAGPGAETVPGRYRRVPLQIQMVRGCASARRDTNAQHWSAEPWNDVVELVALIRPTLNPLAAWADRWRAYLAA